MNRYCNMRYRPDQKLAALGVTYQGKPGSAISKEEKSEEVKSVRLLAPAASSKLAASLLTITVAGFALENYFQSLEFAL